MNPSPEPRAVLPSGYRIDYSQAVSPSEVFYPAPTLYLGQTLLKSFEAREELVADHPLTRENPEGGEVYRTVYPQDTEIAAFAWGHWHARRFPAAAGPP